MTEQEYLDICKKEIEVTLALGDQAGEVRTRDLEYLITAIESKSGTKLSLSTLKRLWREEEGRSPQPATLNALVSILGFDSWQEFKQNTQADEGDSTIQARRWGFPLGFSLAIVFMAILVGYGAWKNLYSENEIEVESEVKFSLEQTLDQKIPNTVIFSYDVSGVKADSFFIQQSWNPANKTRIDPAAHHFSSTYYTPGYHMARLIANDSILAYEPVHLKSDGWFPLVKYDVRDIQSIYINPSLLPKDNDGLTVQLSDLIDAGVDPDREFLLRYYNVKDFNGLSTSNFRLETRFKCDSVLTKVCPRFRVMLIGEANVFYVPVIEKGCEGDLNILVGEQYLSSRSSDLSSFGADMYSWNTLKWEVEDKKVQISLNENPIMDFEFFEDFGEIKGIIYTFNTIGSIEYTSLEDSRTVSYSSE